MTISLEVLVFEGCPHAQPALTLARAVAQRLGPGIDVCRVEVDTPAKAEAEGFLGSPSFRIDGQDLEGRECSGGALSCRTYDDGKGLPPTWLLEARVLRALEPRGLLFLCVANSARSQLAEGIARSLAPAEVKVFSAGSAPTSVRPEARSVLTELEIDSAAQRSKAVSEIPAAEVDTVITLCAEEECPVFLGKARRLHWGLADPADSTLSSGDRLAAFRAVRDELRRRLSAVFNEAS